MIIFLIVLAGIGVLIVYAIIAGLVTYLTTKLGIDDDDSDIPIPILLGMSWPLSTIFIFVWLIARIANWPYNKALE